MTPLTKEQAEALARIFDERARRAERTAETADDDDEYEIANAHRTVAYEFRDIATEIRDGTFIEVQG